MALSENTRGALFMCLSMAAFVSNDTLMKTVADEVPMVQVIFIRGIFASSLLIGMAFMTGAVQKACRVGFTPQDRRLIVGRMVGEIGATFCFLTALFNMPIANATAVLQAAPLAITMAAALFLGEVVGWRRWSASFVGFLGVLLIVRPGPEGFNLYAFFTLGAVSFIVLRDLSTTGLSEGIPSVVISVFTACGITIVGGLASLFIEWTPLSSQTFLVLVGASLFLIFGYLFGVMAMRHGEIGFVSPFRYTIMIWAVLFGILVFAEFPDFWEIAGIAVVIAAGLYTFHRERVRKRL